MALNTTNVPITAGSGTNIETENVPQPASGSGDRQRVQIGGRVGTTTSESANDVAVVVNADAGPGTTAYGLQVRLAGRTPPNYINGSFLQQAISVGIASAVAIPASALTNRRQIYVVNTDTGNSIFLGTNTVTASGSTMGIPVGPGQLWQAPLGPGVALYAISLGGTVTVSVMEIAE